MIFCYSSQNRQIALATWFWWFIAEHQSNASLDLLGILSLRAFYLRCIVMSYSISARNNRILADRMMKDSTGETQFCSQATSFISIICKMCKGQQGMIGAIEHHSFDSTDSVFVTGSVAPGNSMNLPGRPCRFR